MVSPRSESVNRTENRLRAAVLVVSDQRVFDLPGIGVGSETKSMLRHRREMLQRDWISIANPHPGGHGNEGICRHRAPMPLAAPVIMAR